MLASYRKQSIVLITEQLAGLDNIGLKSLSLNDRYCNNDT